MIGARLSRQYSSLFKGMTNSEESRHTFMLCLDPTADIIRKATRKNSRGFYSVFHYNGHGCPLPTAGGELWVFTRSISHYVPLAVRILRQWVGPRAIYILDCSSAGVLLPFLVENLSDSSLNDPEAIGSEAGGSQQSTPPIAPSKFSTIVFAACSRDEMLPMAPCYPADIYTCCLTTPIQISLQMFILQVSKLTPHTDLLYCPLIYTYVLNSTPI